MDRETKISEVLQIIPNKIKNNMFTSKDIGVKTPTLEELVAINVDIATYFGTVYPSSATWLDIMGMQWYGDLMAYQEIVMDTKPTVVIESGLLGGATLMFISDVFALMRNRGWIDNWKLIGIDITDNRHPLCPKDIVYIEGRSVDVVDDVRRHISSNDKVMVLLDSDHNAEYVYQEMCAFAPLVTTGCYLIVEDAYNDLQVKCSTGAGPLGAIARYLNEHDDCDVDFYFQRWLATQNFMGYLKKCK